VIVRAEPRSVRAGGMGGERSAANARGISDEKAGRVSRRSKKGGGGGGGWRGEGVAGAASKCVPLGFRSDRVSELGK